MKIEKTGPGLEMTHFEDASKESTENTTEHNYEEYERTGKEQSAHNEIPSFEGHENWLYEKKDDSCDSID